MSYDPCKYCGQMAFKTDGNADLICYNRANTGDCNVAELLTKEEAERRFNEQKKIRVLSNSIDIKKEHELIQLKQSKLSRRDRELVVEQFNKKYNGSNISS